MECRVKTAFYDKYNGQFHDDGTAYFCTAERFSEIQNQGDFLDTVEPEPEIEEKPAKKRLKE
ncbi:hypothetical protein ACPW7J_02235 [Ihubacter sp. rT4E-8]|uniref:hypothetical protein n=1 Tax=Ihubacter sp. rT4E-8 TaxID=3242369 RepID=UPI003CF7E5B2